MAENLDENGKIILEEIVKRFSKNGTNFIISSSKISRFMLLIARDLHQKYPFRYRENLNVKDVLDIATLKENDEKLKVKCKMVLDYIFDVELSNYVMKEYNLKGDKFKRKKEEIKNKVLAVEDAMLEKNKVEKMIEDINEDKNTYIKYALNQIINSFNSVEYFYNLLKIGEYITHYLGLKSILDDKDDILMRVNADDIRMGMLSTWRNCINFDVEYLNSNTEKVNQIVSENEVIKSIIDLRNVLKIKNEEKEVYTFKQDICQVIADIRNKMMAHGTITYEVSESIVEDLFNIVFFAIKEFENINVNISEDEKIKAMFEKEISLAYKKENKLFLYSYSNYSKKEKKDVYQGYLNYETGICEINNDKVTLEMNLKYSVKDIETALERWVVK